MRQTVKNRMIKKCLDDGSRNDGHGINNGNRGCNGGEDGQYPV